MLFDQKSFQNPSDYDDYNERGLWFLRQGKYQQAIRDFNQSIHLAPDADFNAFAYLNRGICYDNLGQYEPAILDYQVVIKVGILPAIYYAYQNLGYIYQQLGNWEKSAQTNQTGLALLSGNNDPNLSKLHSDMHYNYGMALRNLGNINQAIKQLSKAIILNPSDFEYYVSRSETYLNNNEARKALEDCNKGLQLAQNNPILLWLKGQSLIHLQEFQQALTVFEEFQNADGADQFNNHEQLKQILAFLTTKLINVENHSSENSKGVLDETKVIVAKELMNIHEYEAARAILHLIESNKAKRHLNELDRRQLAYSMESIMGILEEWLQGNKIIADAKKFIVRDAKTYLLTNYSLEVKKSILDELKNRNEMNNQNLEGTSLLGSNLTNINCVNANFNRSNLESANLENSNFMYTRFVAANLSNIHANGALFQDVDFTRASLRAATLTNTNLTDANLTLSDLRSANLQGAILKGAILENTLFDENTTMPNGEKWYSGYKTDKFISPTVKPTQSIPNSQSSPLTPIQKSISLANKSTIDSKEDWKKSIQDGWETLQELDKWNPDSDNFIGRDDGTIDW